MTKRETQLHHVADIDACPCRLIRLLGAPQIKRCEERLLLTGWAFSFPDCRQHWAVALWSEHPIASNLSCADDEEICWAIYGQTDDRQAIYDLVSYLYGDQDFYNCKEGLVGDT